MKFNYFEYMAVAVVTLSAVNKTALKPTQSFGLYTSILSLVLKAAIRKTIIIKDLPFKDLCIHLLPYKINLLNSIPKRAVKHHQ